MIVVVFLRKVGQSLLRVGAARGNIERSPKASKVISNFVVGDPSEPTTKGVAWAIVPEIAQLVRHRLQRLLHHVSRVGGLQASSATPAVHPPTVEPHQLLPGTLIVGLGLAEQLGRGDTWLGPSSCNVSRFNV